MFAARGIVISFSVFVMAYCAASLVVVVLSEKLSTFGQRFSTRAHADCLFVFRMLPLLSATLLTAVLAVPSFLILEPRSTQEGIGNVSLALSLVGLILVVLGVGRAIRALRRSSRIVAAWTGGGKPHDSGTAVTVLQASAIAPPMTVAGIVRPRIWLSHAATSLLSQNELQAALNHELAHVRRHDNLRKLLIRFVPFPGMNGLEAAWLEAGEICADETSVSNADEALDLASALIKLSRFTPLEPPAELMAALVHSPASLVDARVKRLIAWEEQFRAGRKTLTWQVVIATGITASIVCFTYSQLLVRVHALTEWLVR